MLTLFYLVLFYGSFLYVDQLGFNSIAKIENRFVDFLILLALHMDANRIVEKYMKD